MTIDWMMRNRNSTRLLLVGKPVRLGGWALAWRTALAGLPYLVVLAVLWGSALPDYLGATGGVTAEGTPTGNLAYASICFAVAAIAVISVSGRRAAGLSPVVLPDQVVVSDRCPVAPHRAPIGILAGRMPDRARVTRRGHVAADDNDPRQDDGRQYQRDQR